MLNTNTFEASSGPPWVMTFTRSNAPISRLIIVMMGTKSVVGVTSGQVMWTNCCQRLAPSISAAS